MESELNNRRVIDDNNQNEYSANAPKKKGTSKTAVAVQRLREPQLNLVFGALKYEELKRIKISLDTALKNKKDEERKALQKKIDELDKD